MTITDQNPVFTDYYVLFWHKKNDLLKINFTKTFL